MFPQVLGVGYDVIEQLIAHPVSGHVLLGILLVKWLVWAVSLGSGTSGGVLAPLLMMGGALGGLAGMFLPNQGVGFWPLVSMGAVLGGTMRSPFTGIVFVVELTHDLNVILPLILAVTIAHCFTVLTMRRSILTEKVSRRGYHLSREYAVDPLEVLFVREVMRTNVAALSSVMPLEGLRETFIRAPRGQHLFPVTDESGHLVGVLTHADIEKYVEEQTAQPTHARVRDVVRTRVSKAYPDETLTTVVNRMAETGLTGFPVVEPGDPAKLMGLISLDDLLKARIRRLQEEQRRERILPLRLAFPAGARWRRSAKVEAHDQRRNDSGAKWSRITNPDHWNGTNERFNESNAKLVCDRCHCEVPFNFHCQTCGSSKFVLATAALMPGIFCRVCHEGQWHWDCPGCGRRRHFSRALFYDKRAIGQTARNAA